MYAAFNTLQLELERLIILLDSVEKSGQAAAESTKIAELKRKIYSHEKAIKVINREHQRATAEQAGISLVAAE